MATHSSVLAWRIPGTGEPGGLPSVGSHKEIPGLIFFSMDWLDLLAVQGTLKSLLQCMKVKSEREVAQSCPTVSDPMDCSLPGSSIHGIFQARVLEWGAIAFSHIYAQACLNN